MFRAFLQMPVIGSLLACGRTAVTALVLTSAILAVGTDASAQPVRSERPLPARWADPPPRGPVPGRPGGGPNAVQARPVESQATGRVKVDVMVVYANSTGQVDPRLRGLQQQLEMMKFTGFQVLSTHTASLATGQDQSFPIEGGRKMEITLVSSTETQARVRIELFKGTEKTIDTTVSIRNGRTFPIGGPKYQAGSLIFPITVSN